MLKYLIPIGLFVATKVLDKKSNDFVNKLRYDVSNFKIGKLTWQTLKGQVSILVVNNNSSSLYFDGFNGYLAYEGRSVATLNVPAKFALEANKGNEIKIDVLLSNENALTVIEQIIEGGGKVKQFSIVGSLVVNGVGVPLSKNINIVR